MQYSDWTDKQGLLVKFSLDAHFYFFFVAFVSLEGEHDHVILQKFFYLLGNLSLVALALYKCHSMGLLPTATSDWLAFMEHKMASSKTVFFFKFSDLLEHLMCILGKGLFLPKKTCSFK